MTGKLVCIVGIDGAGKTTVAQRLAEDLQAAGHDATYVWCRFESKALKYALAAYNLLFFRRRQGDYRVNRRRKTKLFHNRLVGRLYRRFVIWSYSRQIRRVVGRPLRRGQTVVCDRYVFDSVVDLALDLGLDETQVRETAHRFLRRAPRPDVTVQLVLPPEVAMARKDDVPELSYLSDRHGLYEDLRRLEGWLLVDATQAREAVFGETRAIVRKVLL